ncbi:hypothetical protein [Serinibacter salmoneus]|nr:hypothetical protein [Serinibacter salmoneus]
MFSKPELGPGGEQPMDEARTLNVSGGSENLRAHVMVLGGRADPPEYPVNQCVEMTLMPRPGKPVAPGLLGAVVDSLREVWEPLITVVTTRELDARLARRYRSLPVGQYTWYAQEVAEPTKAPAHVTLSQVAGGTSVALPADWDVERQAVALHEFLDLNELAGTFL